MCRKEVACDKSHRVNRPLGIKRREVFCCSSCDSNVTRGQWVLSPRKESSKLWQVGALTLPSLGRCRCLALPCFGAFSTRTSLCIVTWHDVTACPFSSSGSIPRFCYKSRETRKVRRRLGSVKVDHQSRDLVYRSSVLVDSNKLNSGIITTHCKRVQFLSDMIELPVFSDNIHFRPTYLIGLFATE